MLNSVVGKCLVLLFALANLSNALHFYLTTGETRCFFEDLPDNTLLVGRIDAYEQDGNDYRKNRDLKVKITVDETFDNDHRVVSQKSSPTGEFTFNSHDSGEHRFCLTPEYDDDTTGKTHRIFFDVALGSAHDYADSKSTKKVDGLTAKVMSLNNKLQEIHIEQESMRQKEAIFRDQSETTNSRVVKWTLVQLVVLIGTCYYQLRHLKGFFVKQKIV
ncbi:uncharacterized protein CANTADRAFT_25293 [Suhomyces tanzawaensis NRRL Y-17324]|uniref:Membrane protein n=1 Tax=Suhomyces tanzawaensis NRRL Y-17324 TaxID=984487 RepID=A0A1E4SNC4_9ASCO|nr:uncharacterized protein CANTADRAFT_25293 [Suhomyces tanzawaensis NRRL Y-17324]ODV80996.1 membrane protein [Suhomyces tanzawaensis NRRL Y-17324]